MKRLQWPRARGSVWLSRLAGITVALAAFGLGTTWDRQEARGNIGLALKISLDSGIDSSTRLQAMTSMRRDMLAALDAFETLKSDPVLGLHAVNFSKVGGR